MEAALCWTGDFAQQGRETVEVEYDKLLISLRYPREYRTMEHIGADYGVYKSVVCAAIHRVEDTLV